VDRLEPEELDRRLVEGGAGAVYGCEWGGAKASALQSSASLDNPHSFVGNFFANYPPSSTQLLASEDKPCFHAISRLRGQKPIQSSSLTLRLGSRRYSMALYRAMPLFTLCILGFTLAGR
jgi:hypothetical protein